MTDHGGVVGFESVDGKSLYYTKENDICGIPLFARSLAGGAERQVVDQICARGGPNCQSSRSCRSGGHRRAMERLDGNRKRYRGTRSVISSGWQ